jgi:hypothetical protein
MAVTYVTLVGTGNRDAEPKTQMGCTMPEFKEPADGDAASYHDPDLSELTESEKALFYTFFPPSGVFLPNGEFRVPAGAEEAAIDAMPGPSRTAGAEEEGAEEEAQSLPYGTFVGDTPGPRERLGEVIDQFRESLPLPEHMPLSDLLRQNKIWQDKQGNIIEIDTMSLDYRMNVLAYMLKRARQWLNGQVNEAYRWAAQHDGGDMAQDSLDHIADFYQELQNTGQHNEWLLSTPLARKLAKSIRKDLKTLLAEGSQI